MTTHHPTGSMSTSPKSEQSHSDAAGIPRNALAGMHCAPDREIGGAEAGDAGKFGDAGYLAR